MRQTEERVGRKEGKEKTGKGEEEKRSPTLHAMSTHPRDELESERLITITVTAMIHLRSINACQNL